jgi:hypothetical protein
MFADGDFNASKCDENSIRENISVTNGPADTNHKLLI